MGITDMELTPELVRYILHEAQTSIRLLSSKLDEQSGRLGVMHDQLTALAAARPGESAPCLLHTKRLEDIEGRFDKHEEAIEEKLVAMNARMGGVEVKVWAASGAVALAMAFLTLFGPNIRSAFSMNHTAKFTVTTNAVVQFP